MTKGISVPESRTKCRCKLAQRHARPQHQVRQSLTVPISVGTPRRFTNLVAGVPTSDIEECYSGNALVRVGHGDVRGLQTAHGFCLSRPCISQLLCSNARRPECAKADCSFTSALTARACATSHAQCAMAAFQRNSTGSTHPGKRPCLDANASCLPASF